MKVCSVNRYLQGAALAAVLLAGSAASAQAAPPSPSWTCSAHAAVVNIGGSSGATLDPLHANSDPNARCQDDGATIPTAAAKDILGQNTISLTSGNAQAQTGITNALSPTYQQAPAAGAHLSNTFINIGGDGGVKITAQAVRSYVSGQCRGNTPYLGTPAGTDGGEVLNLRINGTAIPTEGQPDAALTQVFEGLSPLAPVIRVLLNQTAQTTDPATGEVLFRREAVRIELLTAPGAEPLATVVLGSATVDRMGDVCATPPGVTPPGSGGVPVVNPPVLASGGNEPGSNGGGTGAGSGGVEGNSSSGGPNNGKNASECVKLRMWFDRHLNHRANYKSGPTKMTSHRGTRQVVRGVIRNCKGKPVINAKLDQIHVIGSKHRLKKTGLRSRSRGRLTLILPNNLTTRRIVFRYRPFVNGTAVAASRTVRIKVLPHKHR
jgi:hypothetical protein